MRLRAPRQRPPAICLWCPDVTLASGSARSPRFLHRHGCCFALFRRRRPTVPSGRRSSRLARALRRAPAELRHVRALRADRRRSTACCLAPARSRWAAAPQWVGDGIYAIDECSALGLLPRAPSQQETHDVDPPRLAIAVADAVWRRGRRRGRIAGRERQVGPHRGVLLRLKRPRSRQAATSILSLGQSARCRAPMRAFRSHAYCCWSCSG